MTTVDPRPATLAWPPRPPRLLAGVPVGVLACWQAAFLLALSTVDRPLWYVASAGTGAAVLVAASGWRRQRRWPYQWGWLWLRYITRRRATTPGRQPAELALLDLAGRVYAIGTVDDFAIVEHRNGCTAIMELSIAGAARALPDLPLTLAPPADGDGPPVSVQLIVHTRPIPAIAAHARAWLVVQARRDATHATAELEAAVGGAVRRLHRHARRTGLSLHVLDTTRVREALHVVSRLELVGRARLAAVGTERWHTWWTGDVPQRCLRIRSWPGLPGPPRPELYRALLATPSMALTLSVAARRTQSGVVAMELVVRVAERDMRLLDAATRHLSARLTAAGARVERLAGRQSEGLAATLPLGGFTRAGD